MSIAVLGGYGVGMTMRLDHLPAAGETVTGGELAQGHGGKGSNQAVGMARLGATVQLLTAVGRDPAADDADRLWSREKVDTTSIVRTDAPTMTGFILVDSEGENCITIAPGALDRLTREHIDPFQPAIAAAELLVVSLEIPHAVALHALEVARAAGTRTLLNPAPAPIRVQSEAFWPLADVLTPNRTEAERLLGSRFSTAAETAIALGDLTGATVVLTLGADGVVVFDSGALTRIPAARAQEILDTTGAGDAFTAALAVGLSSGATVVESARWAAEAGAFCVSRHGVIGALPRTQDLPPLTSHSTT